MERKTVIAELNGEEKEFTMTQLEALGTDGEVYGDGWRIKGKVEKPAALDAKDVKPTPTKTAEPKAKEPAKPKAATKPKEEKEPAPAATPTETVTPAETIPAQNNFI